MRVNAIKADQMRMVDELAVIKYNILLEQMMELAGYHLSEMAYNIMDRPVVNKKIVVLAGKGNNGGGGLVSARHLYNRDTEVMVMLSTDKGLKPAVRERLKTLKELKLPIVKFKEEKEPLLSLEGRCDL